jgi:glycosyltransferase involved in cell wall biosynthesis
LDLPEEHILLQQQPRVDQFAEGRRFFVSVATLEPRKNILRLIEAFEYFRLHLSDDRTLKLLVVGEQGWLSETDRVRLEHSVAATDGHVKLLGYQPDEMVYRLIKQSLGLVHVALDEGYGFTVREARALGAVTVCSDLEALRQGASTWDVVVDPMSRDGIAQGLAQAMAVQQPVPKRYSRSWQTAASELIDLLEHWQVKN